MILILINNVKIFFFFFLYIFIIFENLIILINFLMIMKRIMCLYINDVDDKKIKILSLKISNDSFFAEILIYNYSYFELNINKFNDIFLKMKIILRKSRISFLLKCHGFFLVSLYAFMLALYLH